FAKPTKTRARFLAVLRVDSGKTAVYTGVYTGPHGPPPPTQQGGIAVDLLLKNAQVYRDHHFAPADLLIRDGRTQAGGPRLTAEAPGLDAGGRRRVPRFLADHTTAAAP